MPHEQDEFVKYLKETFEEDFDPNNFDHLIKQGIFIAGYESGFNRMSKKITCTHMHIKFVPVSDGVRQICDGCGKSVGFSPR